MQMNDTLTQNIMNRFEKLNSEVNYLSNEIKVLTLENELLIKKYEELCGEQTDNYSIGLDSLKVVEVGSSKVSIPKGYKISNTSSNGVLFYNNKTYMGIFEVPRESSFDKKVKEWDNKYNIKTKTYNMHNITLESVAAMNEENIEIRETYFEKNGIKYHIYEKGVEDKIAFNILLDSIMFNYQSLIDKIQKIPQLSATSFGYSTKDGKIKYHNWRLVSIRGSRPTVEHRSLMEDFEGYCERIWFTRYLKHKFPNEDFKINFFGAYETHHTIKWPMDGKKVFYSAEDLNFNSGYFDMKENYDTYALDYVDLSMGFDLIDNEKYLRFPYWAWAHFSPEVTEEEIENKIDTWNSINYKKTRDVVNISSHDRGNTRKKISDDIEGIVEITYGGRWRNNTDELWTKYNNNKEEFMKQFKFNLCAENLVDDGYVTEKIFDSINSACIPLYVGGGNYLEPEILNQDAILRWVMEDTNDNKDTVELFKNIYSDEKTYNEFKDQDILLDSSKKCIINLFADLEKHFERLIYD